jgi:hypothetical protein
MESEKPKEQRLRESITLLKKFPTLGIPLDDPSVVELKTHLDAYIHKGTCWKGSVDFLQYGRIADVDLPKEANKSIEVTLRLRNNRV